MSTNIRLTAVLDASSKGLVDALNRASHAVNGTAGDWKSRMRDMAQDMQTAKNAIDAFSGEIEKIKPMELGVEGAEQIKTNLTEMGNALLSTRDSIEETLVSLSRMRSEASSMNIPFDDYQRLGDACRQAGVDMNVATEAISSMRERIAELEAGVPEATEMFSRLGLSLEALSSNSDMQNLSQISTAMNKAGNELSRASDYASTFKQSMTDVTKVSNEYLKVLSQQKDMRYANDDDISRMVRLRDSLDGIATKYKEVADASGMAASQQKVMEELDARFDQRLASLAESAGMYLNNLVQMDTTNTDLGRSVKSLTMDMDKLELVFKTMGLSDLSQAWDELMKSLSARDNRWKPLSDLEKNVQRVLAVMKSGVKDIQSLTNQSIIGKNAVDTAALDEFNRRLQDTINYLQAIKAEVLTRGRLAENLNFATSLTYDIKLLQDMKNKLSDVNGQVRDFNSTVAKSGEQSNLSLGKALGTMVGMGSELAILLKGFQSMKYIITNCLLEPLTRAHDLVLEMGKIGMQNQVQVAERRQGTFEDQQNELVEYHKAVRKARSPEATEEEKANVLNQRDRMMSKYNSPGNPYSQYVEILGADPFSKDFDRFFQTQMQSVRGQREESMQSEISAYMDRLGKVREEIQDLNGDNARNDWTEEQWSNLPDEWKLREKQRARYLKQLKYKYTPGKNWDERITDATNEETELLDKIEKARARIAEERSLDPYVQYSRSWTAQDKDDAKKKADEAKKKQEETQKKSDEEAKKKAENLKKAEEKIYDLGSQGELDEIEQKIKTVADKYAEIIELGGDEQKAMDAALKATKKIVEEEYEKQQNEQERLNDSIESLSDAYQNAIAATSRALEDEIRARRSLAEAEESAARERREDAISKRRDRLNRRRASFGFSLPKGFKLDESSKKRRERRKNYRLDESIREKMEKRERGEKVNFTSKERRRIRALQKIERQDRKLSAEQKQMRAAVRQEQAARMLESAAKALETAGKNLSKSEEAESKAKERLDKERNKRKTPQERDYREALRRELERRRRNGGNGGDGASGSGGGSAYNMRDDHKDDWSKMMVASVESMNAVIGNSQGVKVNKASLPDYNGSLELLHRDLVDMKRNTYVVV